jgi:hypothetical protein
MSVINEDTSPPVQDSARANVRFFFPKITASLFASNIAELGSAIIRLLYIITGKYGTEKAVGFRIHDAGYRIPDASKL